MAGVTDGVWFLNSRFPTVKKLIVVDVVGSDGGLCLGT